MDSTRKPKKSSSTTKKHPYYLGYLKDENFPDLLTELSTRMIESRISGQFTTQVKSLKTQISNEAKMDMDMEMGKDSGEEMNVDEPSGNDSFSMERDSRFQNDKVAILDHCDEKMKSRGKGKIREFSKKNQGHNRRRSVSASAATHSLAYRKNARARNRNNSKKNHNPKKYHPSASYDSDRSRNSEPRLSTKSNRKNSLTNKKPKSEKSCEFSCETLIGSILAIVSTICGLLALKDIKFCICAKNVCTNCQYENENVGIKYSNYTFKECSFKNVQIENATIIDSTVTKAIVTKNSTLKNVD